MIRDAYAIQRVPTPVVGDARHRGERGQIMLLTMVFAAVTITLVLVVAAASAVHIERKRLVALADSTAVAASDAIDQARYYQGDGSTEGDASAGGEGSAAGGGAAGGARAAHVPLSDATVRGAAADYLAQAPRAVTGEFARLSVTDPTGSPDGASAQVTLTAVARPPMIPWVLVPWSDGITLRATSTARAG